MRIKPQTLRHAKSVYAFGSAFMPVEAVSSLGGLLRQFGALARGDKPGFRYRIRGSVSLVGGTRIPFDRRGEFDLGAIVPR